MKTVLALCYLATWATIPHLLLLKKRPAASQEPDAKPVKGFRSPKDSEK